MGRRIEFFSAGCPLCTSLREQVELGKCRTCTIEVVDVRRPEAARRMRRFGVRVVPTIVIDGQVKVEGRLDEPWVCDDEFLTELKGTHPIRGPQRRPG